MSAMLAGEGKSERPPGTGQHKEWEHVMFRSTSTSLEFKDSWHSLTIDAGWREVADTCLAWLNK